MTLRTAFNLLTAILFLSSCRKEMTAALPSSGDEATKPQALSSLAGEAANESWYGLYTYYKEFSDPDWPGDTLSVYNLVKNGTASFNNASFLPPVTGSSINYEIPALQLVSGDSVVFETRVKSVSNMLGLNIFDDETGSYAELTIDSPVNGKRICTVSVGSSYKTVSLAPTPNYTSFRLVQFALKGTTAFVYVDNKLVVKMPYLKSDRLTKATRLKMFNWFDKMECDRVRLLNSFTKKLRMKEEFNMNGKANTIFY